MQRVVSIKSLLLGTMILSVLAAACSGNLEQPHSQSPGINTNSEEKTNQQQPQPSQQDDLPTPQKQVELVMYSSSGDSEEGMRERYVEPFNKQHPHINLSYIRSVAANGTTLPEMIASGTKFDVYYQGRGTYESQLKDHGIAYDMTDLLNKHNVDYSHLEPTSVEALKQASNGELYGLPVTMLSYLVYYNKALFDRFGVPYPVDGMTWDEMIALGDRMTRSDGDEQFYGFGHASAGAMIDRNHYSLAVADIQAHKPTINADERWKTFIQTLFLNTPVIKAFDELGKIPNWANFSNEQNLAMITYSASVPLALQADITPLDWDMVSIPMFPDLPHVGTQSTPVYFGVTSMSDHKDEATEVIKFLTSIEYMTEVSRGGRLMASTAPEVVSALGKESPFPDKNWGAITYYPFAPLSDKEIYSSKVLSVYSSHINSIISGEVDLNTALRTMEEEAQQVIDSERSQ